MSTTTKHPIITPAAHDLLDCKRLLMSLWSLERTLNGAKTVTRRLLNPPQPPDHADRVEIRDTGPAGHHENGDAVWAVSREYEPGNVRLLATPHWRDNSDGYATIYDEVTRCFRNKNFERIAAPDEDLDMDEYDDWHQIHAGFLMPRWACRAAVRIVDVRVERLGAINDREARLEGVRGKGERDNGPFGALPDYLGPFKRKWNDLHGADSWDPQQWVRRIEYEPIHP